MMPSLMLSVLVGGALGAALGYLGKCTSGACLLTANPWRGAMVGATIGLLVHFTLGRNGSPGVNASTANVSLIGEGEFQAQVLESPLPVVVDFYASWCGPCKRLSPMLDELAGPLADRIRFLKVNVDESASLSARMNIEALPTLLLFQGGRVVDRLVGLPAREALRLRLETLASSGEVTNGG